MNRSVEPLSALVLVSESTGPALLNRTSTRRRRPPSLSDRRSCILQYRRRTRKPNETLQTQNESMSSTVKPGGRIDPSSLPLPTARPGSGTFSTAGARRGSISVSCDGGEDRHGLHRSPEYHNLSMDNIVISVNHQSNFHKTFNLNFVHT